MKSTCPVAIVGGGPVGLLAALLLSRCGESVTLIRRRAAPQAGRSVALMLPSVQILKDAGLWDELAAYATPLETIRLVDATARLLRAPTLTFHAKEIDAPAFAMHIENDRLVACLETAIAQSAISVVDGEVHEADVHKDSVTLSGKNFSIEAGAVIAADGAKSRLRDAVMIDVQREAYPQTAVTALMSHSLPHHNVSTEFHTAAGPMTFVPMAGRRSALVLVTTPEDAEALTRLDNVQFGREVTKRCESFLGPLKVEDGRGAWPLQKMLPACFAAKRIYLAGEAAHVLPPIGAQGLNLGIRDADCAYQLLGKALRDGTDAGADSIVEAYDAARRQDAMQRSFAVDALNKSLLSPYLPVHILRGFGLFLAQKSRFLRNRLMQAGMGRNRSLGIEF